METKRMVKVSYSIGGFDRFIKGYLINETETHIKIQGLKDGAIFEIAKSTITERIGGVL